MELMTMRRKDREITDFSRMAAIMQNCDCCRLGLVDHNEAYIIPMNFGYEIVDSQVVLYFHCAREGRKLDLLPLQSSVAFEMDTGHRLVTGALGCNFSYLYQSIMGSGTVTIVTDPAEKLYALQRIMAHYTSSAQWEFPQNALEKTSVLKLSVQHWSCKEH